MYEIYGFEKYLYANELFFKTFMDLGYQNLYSYYSVVLHERYFKEVQDKKMFVWRDGGDYSFEFSEEPIKCIPKDEVIVRQSDPFTIHLSSYSTGIIKGITECFFK